jgi:hypothetical protein
MNVYLFVSGGLILWLAVSGASIAGQLLHPPRVYPLTFRRPFRNYLFCLTRLADLVCHRYYSLFCQ